MEKAGLAAARIARDKLLIHGRKKILVSPALGTTVATHPYAARHMRWWRYKVTLGLFTGERCNLSDDARRALDAWVASDGKIVETIQPDEEWDAVMGRLFGIGLDQREGRDLTDKYLALVNR